MASFAVAVSVAEVRGLVEVLIIGPYTTSIMAESTGELVSCVVLWMNCVIELVEEVEKSRFGDNDGWSNDLLIAGPDPRRFLLMVCISR